MPTPFTQPHSYRCDFPKSKHNSSNLQVHLSPGEKEMIETLAAGGLSLVGGWFGAYLGAYLKKKGENLATHEDISKLVDQVRAVTQTTKEIEAKISDEVWGRQKQWELKREVLFEATRALARVDDALVGLHVITQVEKKENDINWVKNRLEANLKWNEIYSAFQEAGLLVAAVCSKEAGQAFEMYGRTLSKIAERLAKDIDPQIYMTSQADRLTKHLILRQVVRSELGIEETPALAVAK
jgi:hypothetical protein